MKLRLQSNPCLASCPKVAINRAFRAVDGTLQTRLTKCDLTFARCCTVQSLLLYVLVHRYSEVVC